MPERRLYLDYNATALVDDEVKKNIQLEFANPSSLHFEGRKARNIVENVRSDIIHTFNAQDFNLIFTSSGTEANNMVFSTFFERIHVISSIEHPSVVKSAKNPVFIPVNSQGVVLIGDFELIIKQLKQESFLVSVMLASNETGVIQPIKQIAELTHKYGGIMHTDAAQGCGKIKVDVEDLGVDMISFSPHKFGCLPGFGILLFKKEINMKPLLLGGGQENKLRGGTENVIAISSFQFVGPKISTLITKMEKVGLIRDELENEILKICPEVKVFGRGSNRLPNTSCIAMPNVSNDIQLMRFDLEGLSVGKGSACSSGIIENSSHVLEAMGGNSWEVKNALRISLGYESDEKDIKKIANIWEMLYNELCVL